MPLIHICCLIGSMLLPKQNLLTSFGTALFLQCESYLFTPQNIFHEICIYPLDKPNFKG